MENHVIHKVTSDDGIEIVGKVMGDGRPLVFLPPGPAECEQGWENTLPFLKERFSCYLMNTRGRGLTEDHDDHSPARLVDDVLTFSQSIGKPITLVEWGTSLWAYVAAQNHHAIGAVAVYEPGVGEVMPVADAEQMNEVFEKVWALTADGRAQEAAAYFIERSQVFYTNEDLATGIPYDFWQAAAVNLPIFLAEQEAINESGMPSPMAPSVLTKIKVPVLLMQGTKTTPYFVDSVEYIAKHVQNPHIRKIDQAAHFEPCIHPDVFADELADFIASV